MREYKDCYIAVLDLLGFKNSLENFTCEEIATIFDEINSRYVISFDKTAKPIVKDEDIHFKVMSDTVCIFIEEKVRNALTGLIAICDYLQIRLLRQCVPILSRGAIVKGKIFNDGDILFGDGFVKAYQMQEHLVKSPRVVIDSSALASYQSYDESGQLYLDKYLIKDDDGYFISDYLFIFYGLNHSQESWKRFALYVKAQLEIQDEAIREKYEYLYKKFPEVTKKYMDYLEDEANNV